MSEIALAYLILGIVAIVLILVLSLILFFNISQRRILTEKQKNHQQKMDFQKEMLQATISTQEKERNRIASELHDDIGSKLNVINMSLNYLDLSLKSEDNRKLLSNIRKSLDHSIERSRKMSHELLPPVLKKFGLIAAIEDLCAHFNNSDQLKMSFRCEDDTLYGQKEKNLHIFRIIQELSNNTLKHAGAKEIHLSLDRDEDNISIQYSDDGRGMTEGQLKKGLGMMNIESRAQILNATWKLIPTTKGVKFKFDIPYAE